MSQTAGSLTVDGISVTDMDDHTVTFLCRIKRFHADEKKKGRTLEYLCCT